MRRISACPRKIRLISRTFFLLVFVNRAYHELEKPLGDNPIS